MRIIRKPRISTNMKLLLLLLASILFMGIGYSAINSITGEIEGVVIAEAQEGVFITNVEYVSNVDANLATSEIQYYKGTMMQSKVELSGTNSASEITYKVTVYNNSENSLPFLGVLYDEEFYDNENIIFEISEDGYSLGEFINPKESKDIYITFKYKDGVIPESTILNSYLNFKIAEPNRMLASGVGAASSIYLRGNVLRKEIETINFELGNIQPAGTVSSFDASEKQDESIMGYYTDTDGNGLYELTFASNEIIFANINASNLFRYLTNLKEITFDNFSTYGVTNMSSMFSNCSGLTNLDVSNFDTSQVTTMNSMFRDCRSLTSLNVSKFDTSKVTSMGEMFYYCSSLTSLDVSNFDTSQVTTMYSMFRDCRSLTSLDVSSFDTSQVTTMSDMFSVCSDLTSLDVSKFDTSKVTDMSSMFRSCSGLTSLDVSIFDTSKVTDMSSMFRSCSGLTSLDVSIFDTSQVTDMSSMFYSCRGLTSLDVSSFDTSQVTTMSYMFSYCRGLTSLDVSSFDTSQVRDMSYMFSVCSGLTSLDVSSFDTSQVTGMSYMFNECESLTSLDVSSFDTSQVTNMRSMFYRCSGLTSLDLSNFDTSQVTDMHSMFSDCRGLTSLDVSNFDTSQVTDMGSMFYYCDSLTSLNVSNFDTSQVTNMYRMFYYCSSLTSLDLSNFDTSQVGDMGGMFSSCSGLTSLDVSSFDTSKVRSMTSMFSSCRGLTSLDLSSFDTSQVTNMYKMFYDCRGLTTIYVSEFDSTTNTGWTTSAVTRSSGMFYSCTKLVGGNGTTYDSSHIDKEYARIDMADTPGYFTNITDTYFKSPSELFDAEGTNPEGLHIGDFINYDAGTWTQEEINAIQTGEIGSLVTANGSTELPNTAFQFGGFTAGSSRNGNATPNSSSHNYVKDASTGSAITGWRVFDIEGDTVTLISAGNPEDYHHSYGTNHVYMSEYILTGNINSNWSDGATQAENYQRRDWSNYINTAQKGESATVLTKSRLDEWYTRYTDTANANTHNTSTFQEIYSDSAYHKYQNMVDNYSYYWLSAAYDPFYLYFVNPINRGVLYSNICAYGVRVLVTLSSDVMLTKTGTKTVTGGWTTTYGGDQTYNVWNIK